MDSNSPTSPANDSLVRVVVEDFLVAIEQAINALERHQGVSSPEFLQAVGTARSSCQVIWRHESQIEMLVLENSIVLGQHTIYRSSQPGNNVASLLSNAGVRSVKFVRGFESSDLEEFCLVLHQSRHLPTATDAMAALNSAGLTGVAFNHVEPDRISITHQSTFTVTSIMEMIDSPGVDKHFLGDIFRRRIESPDPATQSETIATLAELVPELISKERLGLAMATLRVLRKAGEKSGLLHETHQSQLCDALESIGGSAAIRGVLEDLARGDLVTGDDIIEEFLACMGTNNAETVLRARESTTRNSLRVILDQALTALVQHSHEHVLTMCQSSDPIIACGAIRLIGQTSRELVDTRIALMIQHENLQVRVAVIEVMVLHGGGTLLRLLAGALHDANRDVRCTAGWGLGTWEYLPAFEELEAILASKKLRDAGMNEMRAMFSAYARVGKQKALPTLGKILNKKSFLGGRQAPELRVCAARALAGLGSSEALVQLRKAQDDSEPAVRRAVLRSLTAKWKL